MEPTWGCLRQPNSPGLMIPILGKRVAQTDGLTHGWLYYGSVKGGVDGHPSFANYKGAGSFGLSVAMMINEQTRKKPNCIFKCDHVIIAQPIKKGEELTVYYGKAYDVIRKLKGYNLDKNRYLDAPHPALDDMKCPSSKIRNNNIEYWLNVISEMERKLIKPRVSALDVIRKIFPNFPAPSQREKREVIDLTND